MLQQALLELLEVRTRVEDRHMPSEFPLERRHLEPPEVDQVHLLAESDVEPDALARTFSGTGSRTNPSVFSKKVAVFSTSRVGNVRWARLMENDLQRGKPNTLLKSANLKANGRTQKPVVGTQQSR